MAKQLGQPYRSVLNMGDFGAVDKLTVINEWVQIGTLTVPDGVAYALGYGGLIGQDSAAGRIYADLNNTVPADLTGDVRFELRNPRDEVVRTLFECRTEQLRTSATDRTQQLPFPIVPIQIGENWRIVIMFRDDAAGTTFDQTPGSASPLVMDITVWPVVD